MRLHWSRSAQNVGRLVGPKRALRKNCAFPTPLWTNVSIRGRAPILREHRSSARILVVLALGKRICNASGFAPLQRSQTAPMMLSLGFPEPCTDIPSAKGHAARIQKNEVWPRSGPIRPPKPCPYSFELRTLLFEFQNGSYRIFVQSSVPSLVFQTFLPLRISPHDPS
jgi:hypothetical protein